MTSLRLKPKFNKANSAKNRKYYKCYRYFCLKLLRQTKEKNFTNLKVKKVSDNKTFCKLAKPFFLINGLNTNKILLVEENKIVSDDEKILVNNCEQLIYY